MHRKPEGVSRTRVRPGQCAQRAVEYVGRESLLEPNAKNIPFTCLALYKYIHTYVRLCTYLRKKRVYWWSYTTGTGPSQVWLLTKKVIGPVNSLSRSKRWWWWLLRLEWKRANRKKNRSTSPWVRLGMLIVESVVFGTLTFRRRLWMMIEVSVEAMMNLRISLIIKPIEIRSVGSIDAFNDFQLMFKSFNPLTNPLFIGSNSGILSWELYASPMTSFDDSIIDPNDHLPKPFWMIPKKNAWRIPDDLVATDVNGLNMIPVI